MYLDLICAARGEFGVAHDGAADLETGYGLLDYHLAVIAQGIPHGGAQVRGVFPLCDAEG